MLFCSLFFTDLAQNPVAVHAVDLTVAHVAIRDQNLDHDHDQNQNHETHDVVAHAIPDVMMTALPPNLEHGTIDVP